MDKVVDFGVSGIVAVGVAAVQGALTAVALKGALGVFAVSTVLPGGYIAVALLGAQVFGSFYGGMFLNFFAQGGSDSTINGKTMLLGAVVLFAGAYFLQTDLITNLALVALNLLISFLFVSSHRENKKDHSEFLTTSLAAAILKPIFKLFQPKSEIPDWFKNNQGDWFCFVGIAPELSGKSKVFNYIDLTEDTRLIYQSTTNEDLLFTLGKTYDGKFTFIPYVPPKN
jgi:hypothetical protein